MQEATQDMAFNGPDAEEGPTIIVVRKGDTDARQIVFNRMLSKPEIKAITIDEARSLWKDGNVVISRESLMPTIGRMTDTYCSKA